MPFGTAGHCGPARAVSVSVGEGSVAPGFLAGSGPPPPAGRGSRQAERPGSVCQEAAPFGGGCDIALGSGATRRGFLARARLQERGRWHTRCCLGWGEEVASGHFLRLPVAQCGGSGWGWGGKRAFQMGWAADRSGAGVSLQEGETEREHLCLSLPNSSLPVCSPTTVWWTL